MDSSFNIRTAITQSKVVIERQGNFTLSSLDVVDEIEIFRGADNPIIMVQSYTKTVQCKFKLRAFPFDTQVITQKYIQKCKIGSHRSHRQCKFSHFFFLLLHRIGPWALWSSSRDVRVCLYIYMYPFIVIFFKASHWPSDQMISSRPLIGQPSSTRVFNWYR